MSTDNCIIFDFETMSQDPQTGVVLSFAMISYSDSRFCEKEYSYDELLGKSKFIKFKVDEQVKEFDRKIEKDTVEWWKNQSPEARKAIQPLPTDRSIKELYGFILQNKPTNLTKVFTRRNTFDPVFITSLMKATDNPEPYDWWLVRDTISYIEGLSHGVELSNNFIPEDLAASFIKHDPRHDIAMDVIRMQTLIRALTLGAVHN